MQDVLVHIDRDLGPIGAWSHHEDTGRLVHFYPESLDLAISGRARQLMAERAPGGHVPTWFAYLATLHYACDTYEYVRVPDDVALVDLISEYRRAWNASV